MSLVRLRVLVVEDSDNDTQLLLRELKKNGYDVSHRRVQTEEETRAALKEEPWDLIVSDYSMPDFNATAALRVVIDAGLDIPFIIVSGTIGEETAVEALKLGAQDFMIKGRLARLGPSIERALGDLAARRAQREMAAANRASEARFRAIMNTSKDAVISADSSGAITYANPAAVRIFGYSDAELIGMKLSQLIPAIDATATASASVITEMVGKRRDGSELPVELSLATWVANEEQHFASIVRDVTDRKRVEAQLLVADRMVTLGSLAASVAHEINNPLAAVVANVELALRDLGELMPDSTSAPIIATLLEELTDVREAAGRVRGIVRDLRVLSRGEDEKPGLVDIERVIESTLRLASNEVRHHARVVKEYTPVPPVHGTEARLGQVFLNLIMNAAQAIPLGQVDMHNIRIATRFEGGRVIVEVADTGEGIRPEVLRKLFTPFLTTKPAGVGTGLGLSICHRIVSGCGGEITVESELGRGTIFRVSLLPGS